MREKRFYLLLALIVLLVWAGFTVWRYRKPAEVQLTQTALDFTLSDSEGKPITLSALRGKVVLLNFWATWCGPCREEMPSLEALYQKFRHRDFVVLGVSVDEEGWAAIKSYLKIIPISFPIVLDADQKVGEIYQTFRIPETYLIDRHGIIQAKFVGPQDYNREVFTQKVESLLNTK